jgi:nitroreductase
MIPQYTIPLKELLLKRFSKRNFLPRDIESEKLEYILECARLAPSACNYQPWKFIVVQKSEAIKTQIRESYNREWFANAPVYIVVVGDHNQSWKRADGKDSCDIDTSIAAQHICLAAEELRLATCWVCNFNLEKLRASLPLEKNLEPVAIFPIGYPDEEKIKIPLKIRKNLEEITTWL